MKRISMRGLLFGLVVLATGVMSLSQGCTVEKTQVPPKVAKALDLTPAAEGPDKGKVMVTPEQAKVYAEDYAAQLAAAEAKAKAERDAKVQDAKDRAEAVAAAAIKQVGKTKKVQARALKDVLDAQADELEAIADNAAETQLTLLHAQKLAATRADEILTEIVADRDSAARAFAAAEADQRAREEKRLGVLNGVRDLAGQALTSVPGPWGIAAGGVLGLLGGWLGLSKPSDKKALATVEDKADALAGTVQTMVKAIGGLDLGPKLAAQDAVAKISTPTDELHITEAKAMLKI